MSYRLPPLPALRAFEAAARHLSFRRAAEELCVTPAAISQQIKSLETWLGVSLFQRLPRSLELTPKGLAMLPGVREGFDSLAGAVASVRENHDDTLTVTAPPSFASNWLVPRLPHFSNTHPEVVLRLSTNPDTVDRPGQKTLPGQAMTDPREESNSLEIRYGTGDYPGCHVDRIFAPYRVPVCSPYLPTLEKPLTSPSDLARHVLIHDETTPDELAGWAQWLRAAGVSEGMLDSRRGPRFSNAVLAVDAALAGHGVALALKAMVEAHLAAGRLIIPFDLALPSPWAYFLVMSEVVARRPAVALFRTWLLEEGARQDSRGG